MAFRTLSSIMVAGAELLLSMVLRGEEQLLATESWGGHLRRLRLCVRFELNIVITIQKKKKHSASSHSSSDRFFSVAAQHRGCPCLLDPPPSVAS